MARGTWIVLTLLAALATGCATRWDVDAFEAPEAAVAAKRTFYFKGGDFGTPASIKPEVVSSTNAEVRKAIVTELTRKGYAEAASAAGADMALSYQVSGTRRFDVAEQPRIGAPSPNTVLSPSEMQPPPASEVPREITMRDGAVLVFLDDPQGKLMWRGRISTETRVGSTEQLVRMIVQMARQIAETVPARSGAAR